MTGLLCPTCQTPFREVLRDGVLVDVCTQCRGVWLDRGELEKLLALAREDSSFASPPPPPRRDYESSQRYYESEDRHRHGAYSHHHKRPKSKLEMLFDVFD